MTKAKQEIIELNKDSVSKFIEHLQTYKDYNEAHLKLFQTHKNLDLFKCNESIFYTSTDSFYKLYLAWIKEFNERGQFNKQNFSKKLSMYGINTSVIISPITIQLKLVL